MIGPGLKIRDLLLMDLSEEEWSKARAWLKQKAQTLGPASTMKGSLESPESSGVPPGEMSSESEESQDKREILVPPGYSREEWNHIGDLL